MTVAASVGFYPLLYVADLPAAALYALFAPIAIGLLSAIPGSGRRQAFVVLRALPPALGLAALGTFLAVDTWSATGGMLVIGFLLAFAAVAGPRPAGAAPGLQLFYILACFPPYAPDALGERLTGLAAGMLLLAASHALLPDPPVPSYRKRLAAALATAARGVTTGEVTARDLRDTGARMRLSRVPPSERPAGAGRTDRALEQGGRAVRRLLDQLAALPEWPSPAPDHASDTLLGRVAVVCDTCADSLVTGRRPPAPGALEQAMRNFQSERVRTSPGPVVPARPAPEPPTAGANGRTPSLAVLRRQSRVLALAESARIVEVTVDIAANGRPADPPAPRELFWYAELSTPKLWARRVLGNATLRSVLFQNAVRTALGLAASRLVAGSLDLDHGFWVLLAVLTLGRTTVGATWRAARRALAGNAVGALVAGALLIGLGAHTDAYAILLAPAMLVGFPLGPMLGTAYTQGLFTLVVATAFAQLAPVTWRLSEARMVDVATGSVIGLLCGLLAWPAGAGREVRRAMAELLRTCDGVSSASDRGGTADPVARIAVLAADTAQPAPASPRGGGLRPVPERVGNRLEGRRTGLARGADRCTSHAPGRAPAAPLRPPPRDRASEPLREPGPHHRGRSARRRRPDRLLAHRRSPGLRAEHAAGTGGLLTGIPLRRPRGVDDQPRPTARPRRGIGDAAARSRQGGLSAPRPPRPSEVPSLGAH